MDPIKMPFRTVLRLLGPHLLHAMMREGIGIKEAKAALEAAEISPDEAIVDRMNGLIKEGIKGVIRRHPSNEMGKTLELNIELFDKDNLN